MHEDFWRKTCFNEEWWHTLGRDGGRRPAERGGGDGPAEPVRFAVRGAFASVLDRLGASLTAACMPHRVVLLGVADGRLNATESFFSNPFGLAADDGRLAVATGNAITVFGTDPRLAAHHPSHPNHYDAFFVPRTIHVTGGCATHDIAFAGPFIIAANTAFSCVCRIDGVHNFTPLWRPSFVTALMPEDRCHLNGFTGEDGHLCYVTALGRSDERGGWRATRNTGGLLIDAKRDRILRDDLCLPHSPRLVGDRLYVLNGGQGEVLQVDRETGQTLGIVRLPAFTHGLCHHGGVLFVGMSRDRLSRTGGAPPVAQREAKLVAGIAAVDAQSGDVLGSIEFDGLHEVTDVQVLPGIRRAGIQSLVGSDTYDGVSTPEGVFWLEGEARTAVAAATGNYPIKLDIKVS